MNAITRSIAATLLAVATTTTLPAFAATPQAEAAARATVQGNYIVTADGVRLYYKDWGPKDGPVVTFSHGWPLSSDSWESQMLFLPTRAIAWSPTTAAATAAPASPGTAMTWTTTPTTLPR